MPNRWTDSLEGLLRTSDSTIDPCEHRYIRELAEADQIDVWKVKDILDRCVCFALSSGFVIQLLNIIMNDECKVQGISIPRETRLNLLDNQPNKLPAYDDQDIRLMIEREAKNGPC